MANYSFSLLSIGLGIATANPYVIVDIIGLGLSLIDDFIAWDSLLGNDTTDYSESTLWLDRTQSFKFLDPSNKWHIFRPLQAGLSGNEETKIYFPLKRNGNANWIELKNLADDSQV